VPSCCAGYACASSRRTCRAVDQAGAELGEVTGVQHGPGADLLVLRRPTGGTALVPFVKAIVPAVDLGGGRVVLSPPEGLLDL
jgi:16S rRNA processing protein RimM